MANSAEIFGRHDLEEECYWQLVGGNRDAVKYPIMHRTAPAMENDQVPDVNGPKAEKLWDIQQSASQKPEKEGKDLSAQSWAQRVHLPGWPAGDFGLSPPSTWRHCCL